MRYKLLTNKHSDKNGKDYFKGDVIESDVDLCKSFPNKFLNLEEAAREAGATVVEKLKYVWPDGTIHDEPPSQVVNTPAPETETEKKEEKKPEPAKKK